MKKYLLWLVLAMVCTCSSINAAILGDWEAVTRNAEYGVRSGALTLYFDNKFWIISGTNGTNSFLNDAWYSTNGTDWTAATRNAQFSARALSGGIIYDNKMWLIGGIGIVGMQADVWNSTDGVDWVSVTKNPSFLGKRLHTVLNYDNKLWVIGGQMPASPEGDVWYSTNGADWTAATRNAGFQIAPFAGRFGHSSVVFDNKMWVIGGSSNGAQNDVWYSTNGADWTAATRNAQFSKRYTHTSVVLGNKIWVIGGTTGTVGLNDVWYSTNGVEWIQDTSGTFENRDTLGSISLNETMYVMNGSNSGTYYADVWSADLLPTPTVTNTITNTITPTMTVTVTITPTATVTITSTSTSTPILQMYRNERVQAFWYDITGNTVEAVKAYYNTASSSAKGRGMFTEMAWMIYDAGHVLVKKFKSETNWNQETKRIRLIKTPEAQATAKALFIEATVTPVIYLLNEVKAHATIVATIGQTPVANKIKMDINYIQAVETYIAE